MAVNFVCKALHCPSSQSITIHYWVDQPCALFINKINKDSKQPLFMFVCRIVHVSFLPWVSRFVKLSLKESVSRGVVPLDNK